jgi:hypothetical protein
MDPAWYTDLTNKDDLPEVLDKAKRAARARLTSSLSNHTAAATVRPGAPEVCPSAALTRCGESRRLPRRRAAALDPGSSSPQRSVPSRKVRHPHAWVRVSETGSVSML